MYREEDCGCGQHGEHHQGQYQDKAHGHGENWAGGGYGHHGMQGQGGGCRCGCHHHENMGFHRRFVSREEIIERLEDYLKQLQAEAKGVEEHIAKLKTEHAS